MLLGFRDGLRGTIKSMIQGTGAGPLKLSAVLENNINNISRVIANWQWVAKRGWDGEVVVSV